MRRTNLDTQEPPSFESKRGVMRFAGEHAQLPEAEVLGLPNRDRTLANLLLPSEGVESPLVPSLALVDPVTAFVRVPSTSREGLAR